MAVPSLTVHSDGGPCIHNRLYKHQADSLEDTREKYPRHSETKLSMINNSKLLLLILDQPIN